MIIGKFSPSLTKSLLFLLILNLGTLLSTLACPYCPHPTPPKLPPKHLPPPPILTPKPPPSPPKTPLSPPKPPPKVKPPPSPPKPPKSPPIVTPPPSVPKPPVVKPPYIQKPPIVRPPTLPPSTPPISVPNPPTPVGTPRPPLTPATPVPVPYPAPPPENQGQTCSIDTLKLGACVDLLGGLVNVGIGSSSTKDTCCPVIEGLVDLDAAICLCTTIKAKLLNINIIVPIALQVLIDCGKTPPPDFECA